MVNIFKTLLFTGLAILLSVNVYNYLDKLYGYQMIQYFNLTELVPTETYRAKFDITIQPHSNESYLLGSYIYDDDTTTRRNISIFIDPISYETYIPTKTVMIFNTTLQILHYKDYDNYNNQPVILSYLPYHSSDTSKYSYYYNEIYDTNANWLVLTNNNNHAIHVTGNININNYYYLHYLVRKVIDMPFVYHNLVNYGCILTALLLFMI
jgi:hypothetical protein